MVFKVMTRYSFQKFQVQNSLTFEQNFVFLGFMQQISGCSCILMFLFDILVLVTRSSLLWQHTPCGLWWRNRQSKRLAFTSEIVYEELVNDALPKVVDFLPVLRFPPTGNVNRVGWD